MISRPHILLAGVFAAALSVPVASAPSGAVTESIPGVFPMDCAKWKDAARCEAFNRTIETCRDKTDDDWRHCMHLPPPAAKFMPPKARDCSAARKPELCEANNHALAACREARTSNAHRKCVAAELQASAAGKN